MARALPDLIVAGVRFEEDGSMMLDFMQPLRDVKANGVQLQHSMYVPAGDEYDDEMDAVRDAVRYLINDILEDLPNLPAVKQPPSGRRPIEDDDDDDDD